MFSSFDGQTPAGRRLEESAENRNEENQAHLRNSEQKALESSASQRGRSLSTPQQEADLTTVLGALVNICVTKQPTSVPTTAAPTLKPTVRPTRSPTTFEGLAGTRDVCVNGANGCLYQRDVLFFVCKDGYEEVTECRYQNSDMYCCPKKSASSQNGVLHDFAWVASVLALALSLILA